MIPASAARRSPGGVWPLILLLLTGCATAPQSARLDPSHLEIPARHELTGVPFFPQEAYQCGPAALATALDASGLSLSPEALVSEVYLPERRGSLQLELLAAARRHGAVPYVLRPRFDHLLSEVAAGNPVIVLQNLALAWYPKWHYAVAVGYDLDRGEMVLRSGRERRHVVGFEVFERTWQRGDYWALVVMPPGRLPATADENGFLQAILPLERIRRYREAAAAYEAASRRWPRSLGAWIGLGNSRYALADLPAAEAAYRAAIRAQPSAAAAHNNLAQVLADEGRLTEAEAAARHAVDLGGPLRETYIETLAQIRARRGETR